MTAANVLQANSNRGGPCKFCGLEGTCPHCPDCGVNLKDRWHEPDCPDAPKYRCVACLDTTLDSKGGPCHVCQTRGWTLVNLRAEAPRDTPLSAPPAPEEPPPAAPRPKAPAPKQPAVPPPKRKVIPRVHIDPGILD